MEATQDLQLDADLLAVCHRVATHLVARNPRISAALIATADGFEICSEALEPDAMAKLAAMSSSMIALADAVVREMKLRSGANIVIEADLGIILMQGVPYARGKVLLTLVAESGTAVADLSYAADQAAAELMIGLA